MSALLDKRLDQIWKDMESQLLTSTVRRFIEVTEDLGIAMANVFTEKDRNQKEIAFVTSNICKFLLQSLHNSQGVPGVHVHPLLLGHKNVTIEIQIFR